MINFVHFFFLVELTVVSLPLTYMEKVCRHIAIILITTMHIEFYVKWIKNLLSSYKPHKTIVLTLQSNLCKRYADLSKV